MRELMVVATCMAESPSKAEDLAVPGRYRIAVPIELADGIAAGIALDVFHETVPVKVLDDFAFAVYAGAEEIFEADDYQSYSGGQFGDFLGKEA